MALAPAGRGPEVMGVFLLFLIVTTIATALRVYCRTCIVRQFGVDDWLSVIAWALFVCHAAFAINGVYHGTGQHTVDIQPPEELITGLKWWWFCEPFYVLSNMAIKASIVMMLLRFLIEVKHRVILWSTLVITEVYSAAFFLVFVCQCSPTSHFWMRFAGGEGSCIDTSIIVGTVYAYSVIICIGDWALSILPCIVVWNLPMKRRERLLVGVVLAMSAVASIATIARLPYVHTLSNQEDFLYATADVAIWSCCEEGLAITACCCVTLRPLFRRFVGTTRSASYDQTASYYTQTWPTRRCERYAEERESSGSTEVIWLPIHTKDDKSQATYRTSEGTTTVQEQ